MNIIIGIIGLGFVGEAIYESFTKKDVMNIIIYDKYKNNGIGNFEDVLKADILFLCLPTVFDNEINEYNKTSIHETCQKLKDNLYDGLIVIKSTVEPKTINNLEEKYDLDFVHNPEFLSVKSAFSDFHNQKHIVLGKASKCSEKKYTLLQEFYKNYYPDAEISTCESTESESTKLFLNCFYSVKIQFFNEIYLLCQSLNIDYDKIRELMLKNKWINPMHTLVPGTDGKLSYGGMCFPKDTNALLNFMKSNNVPHKVLEATIDERNEFRDDNINISK